MNQPELTALVDCLRGLPRETEWLEFKHNNADPEEIGEYLSALANEAALLNQPRGYLIFGIEDASHAVVGCRFDPYTAKAKGNQDLLPWLAAHLQPNPGIEPHCLEHPDGRVALLAVGPARGRPVEFRGQGYCRAGTSKTKHQSPGKSAQALVSGCRLVCFHLRRRQPGRSRPRGHRQGPRAVSDQASPAGQRAHQLGRPHVPQQGPAIAPGGDHPHSCSASGPV
jgi:hypothetical protein